MKVPSGANFETASRAMRVFRITGPERRRRVWRFRRSFLSQRFLIVLPVPEQQQDVRIPERIPVRLDRPQHPEPLQLLEQHVELHVPQLETIQPPELHRLEDSVARQTLVEIGTLLQLVGEGVADDLVALIQFQREPKPLAYGVAELSTAVCIIDGVVVDGVGKGPVGVAKPAREFGAVELYE